MAAIAQLGERQTEDLKVPGSIPGGGMHHFNNFFCLIAITTWQQPYKTKME